MSHFYVRHTQLFQVACKVAYFAFLLAQKCFGSRSHSPHHCTHPIWLQMMMCLRGEGSKLNRCLAIWHVHQQTWRASHFRKMSHVRLGVHISAGTTHTWRTSPSRFYAISITFVIWWCKGFVYMTLNWPNYAERYLASLQARTLHRLQSSGGQKRDK